MYLLWMFFAMDVIDSIIPNTKLRRDVAVLVRVLVCFYLCWYVRVCGFGPPCIVQGFHNFQQRADFRKKLIVLLLVT